jgi:SAM-dependent methyltransferase
MQDKSFDMMVEVEKKHWWFRVKRELLVLLVKRFLKKHKNNRILDIGCGTGLNSEVLQEFGEVYSVDPSLKALDFCRDKGLKNVLVGKVEELPFTDSIFDMVIALDVIEHVKDDVGAVNEIRRVLKPGGIFICFVPAFMFLWSEQDEKLMHYRRYTRDSLSSLFGDGWASLKKSYYNFFLFPLIFVVRFLRKFSKKKLGVDEISQGALLNPCLYFVFRAEVFLLRFINFPYGVSVMCVLKKK